MLARSLDPQRNYWPLISLLFITVGLGIIDELNQYFFLTPGNSTYVDFNDFVLNQIGALGGVFAYYAGLQRSEVTETNKLIALVSRLTLAAYGLFGLAILLLVSIGRLDHSPEISVPAGGIQMIDGRWTIFLEREPGLLESWQTSFGGDQYYVLGIFGGLIVMVLLTLFVFAYRSALLKEK